MKKLTVQVHDPNPPDVTALHLIQVLLSGKDAAPAASSPGQAQASK